MAPRVWFITGTSSGIGFATAKIALEKGDNVVATLRNPAKSAELKALSEKYSSSLLILPFDVTKKDTIAATFAKAIEKFGRIDVVFNNAGFGIVGEAEGTPEADARKVFDVDFWAAANITQEAIKTFREVNPKNGAIGGAILQSSSLMGTEAVPGLSYYSAVKSALIAYSDGVRVELDPNWNITITSIAFGYVYTNALDATVKPPAHPAYGSHLPSHMIRGFSNAGRSPGGILPEDAAGVVYKIIEFDPKDRPPLLPIGMDSAAGTRRSVDVRKAAADKGEELSKGLKVQT